MEGLKLTTYLGERDRAGAQLLADALIDLYARHSTKTSALFRGVEGFGLKHRLQTQRLLTLSEDLPVVSVAVDSRERIDALVGQVRELSSGGLITLERAQLAAGPLQPATLPDSRALKLTIYIGRQARAAGRPAHLAVVELLHRHGVAGATVLLGVDGTAHGARQRGRFFGRNTQVPLMILSVGSSAEVARALPELYELLGQPLLTLERVQVLKRDGALLAELPEPRALEAGGRSIMQKLTVYVGEQAHHEGRPLYSALIGRLLSEGASGATALRGLWGYHGAHRPHGESMFSLRRRVPVITVIVDTPANTRRWFRIVDEMTRHDGLVTSETVPIAWA